MSGQPFPCLRRAQKMFVARRDPAHHLRVMTTATITVWLVTVLSGASRPETVRVDCQEVCENTAKHYTEKYVAGVPGFIGVAVCTRADVRL